MPLAPSPEEQNRVKQQIQVHEHLLALLEQQVLSLEDRLHEIAEQRSVVCQQIDAQEAIIATHRAYLSPIRFLPDDILREIFLSCRLSAATLNPREAPILLTHICRRWRKTAHATPRLWSSLHVNPFVGEYERLFPDDSDFEGITDWIRRACATPLSVAIRASGQKYFDIRHLSLAKGLFSSLSGAVEGSSWESFSFSFNNTKETLLDMLQPLQNVPASPFRSARKLTLSIIFDTDEPNGFEAYASDGVVRSLVAMDLLSNTKLRELALICFSCWGPEASVPTFIPCGQLQVLDLHSHSARHTTCLRGDLVVPLLQDCPNLAIFKADIEAPSMVANQRRTIAQHKLAQLSFSFSDLTALQDIDTWLPLIELPALVSLHMRNRKRIEPAETSDAPVLPYTGQRLGSALTSVVLDLGAVCRPDLLHFLSATPQLVQLHIKQLYFADDFGMIDEMAEDTDFTDEVILALTPSDNPEQPFLCPRLQYLKWQYNTEFTDDALATFLLRRASSPRTPLPLKQVHVDFGRYSQRDIMADCAALVQGGLDLRLNYFDPIDPLPPSNVLWADLGDGIEGYTWLQADLPLVEDSRPGDFGWE